MPVNLMPPDRDPYAGRMAELDALIAKERVRVQRTVSCGICGTPLQPRQKLYCGVTCSRVAFKRCAWVLRGSR